MLLDLFRYLPQLYFTPSSSNFKIYWNIPTFQCHQYGINFKEVSANFGIIQNDGDEFRGNKFVIMYDPGEFPAILNDSGDPINSCPKTRNKNDIHHLNITGKVTHRNGGVPQNGNISSHLTKFISDVEDQVEASFDGVAIIDMESWRPIYRQNWGTLTPNQELSMQIAKVRHPSFSQDELETSAESDFERAAKNFMLQTLQTARKLRPNAKWGYYAYPYCYNWSSGQQSDDCSQQTKDENDRQ